LLGVTISWAEEEEAPSRIIEISSNVRFMCLSVEVNKAKIDNYFE